VSVGPAEGRGGSSNPLGALRRNGLKKAARTSVVADMVSEAPRKVPERLHAVPQFAENEPAENPDAHAVPAPPADSTAETASTPETREEQPAVPAPAAAAPLMPEPVAARETAPTTAPAPAPVQPPVADQAPPQYSPAPVTSQPLPQPAVQAPVQPAAETPAQAQQAPTRKYPKKTAFHQSEEAGARMRSAFLATRHLTGYQTLSEFICAIIDRECTELENQYNDGEPFTVDPNSIPRGRPVRI
jgi:hypothetical protein